MSIKLKKNALLMQESEKGSFPDRLLKKLINRLNFFLLTVIRFLIRLIDDIILLINKQDSGIMSI